MKPVVRNQVAYILNEQEKTASVTHSISANGDIIIPQTIYNNSQEYVVTSILKRAFAETVNLLSVEFAPDS
ncbi:hypothetical protein M9Y10_043656 [Tritrichomonas musculus]|uniref:Uncharacterized protein n=1 Tax=Tritrichomonas musculus TaxID=1915356 RepID=A0ABR2K0B5_9EUKA